MEFDVKALRRKLALAGVVAFANLAVWVFGMDRIATWLAPFAVALVLPVFWPGAPKSLHMRLSLAFVASCVTILVFDGALRIVYTQHLHYRPYDRLVHRWPSDSLQSRLRANARIEMDAHGDLAAMTGVEAHRFFRRVRFHTDQRGFRNGTASRRPVDLILLGDSFLMGCGTSQDEIIGSELERLGGYSIHSLAIPSGPWEQLMILKSELPRLDVADGATVLWGLFTGNDLDDTCRSRLEPRAAGWFERVGVRCATFRNRSPLRQLTSVGNPIGPDYVAVHDADRPVLFYRPHIARCSRTVADIEGHPNHGGLKAVFLEVLRFVSARGLRIKVLTIPSKPQVYPGLSGADVPSLDAFSTVIGRWCAGQDVPFLALKPHFDRAARARIEARDELLWWRDDTHWNGNGHRLAARVVHERLLPR